MKLPGAGDHCTRAHCAGCQHSPVEHGGELPEVVLHSPRHPGVKRSHSLQMSLQGIKLQQLIELVYYINHKDINNRKLTLLLQPWRMQRQTDCNWLEGCLCFVGARMMNISNSVCPSMSIVTTSTWYQIWGTSPEWGDQGRDGEMTLGWGQSGCDVLSAGTKHISYWLHFLLSFGHW